MKHKFIEISVFILWSFFVSCDADLFKTEDEAKEPEVSEIESSAINFTLNVGDTARFWVTASDPDGKKLTYSWEKTEGYFLSTTDRAQVLWRAPLHGGDITLRVRVSSGEKEVTRSRIVRIISSEKPVVTILKPTTDEYLVQYQSYEILVEAFHDNGISVVKFYADNIFKGNMNLKSSNIFNYYWQVDDSAGVSTIKVIAEANAVNTFNEAVTQVRIEGVIPGKK